jgi:maleate cis-trans isomerase
MADSLSTAASGAPLRGALGKLEGFPVPERRIGFVSPLAIADVVPYMFYATFRERVMLVMQTLSLAGYDRESARAALADIETVLAGIARNGAEMIIIGGSVLSFAYDRPQLLSRLTTARAKLGIPVTTDMEAAAETMRAAGVRSVAVGHRLPGVNSEAMTKYFQAAGFSVAGIVGPNAGTKRDPSNDPEVHLEIGQTAARLHPDADAIFILGGSFVNYPCFVEIQRSTGKPGFNNTMGLIA